MREYYRNSKKTEEMNDVTIFNPYEIGVVDLEFTTIETDDGYWVTGCKRNDEVYVISSFVDENSIPCLVILEPFLADHKGNYLTIPAAYLKEPEQYFANAHKYNFNVW